MKPFSDLTARGQALRLRRMALVALDHYDLDAKRVSIVTNHLNGIFRVDASAGGPYVLRISHPTWRTRRDLQSELMWLRALAEETDIGAPEPIPTRGGSFIVDALVDGVPESRRCVVMSWLPGCLLAKRLTETNLYRMGALFARLHAHAAGFAPPGGFTTRRMDSIYARGEEDVLFSHDQRDAFTPYGWRVFEQLRTRVSAAFADLYTDARGLCVIHNDLHHENIKLYRGRLRPFDFEDTLWGYPVQDIAMALQDLMVDVTPERYELLHEAFRQGYESHRPWPEAYPGQIDTFRAGRVLWVANYVARYEREYLAGFIQRLTPQLEAFLQTGKLRKR